MTGKKRFSADLSHQQIACLERLARGYTYAQIAYELSLSEHTIASLISSASHKLSASSSVHAVVISIKENLIQI